MKFETVESTFKWRFGFLSSRNFATMATWRNIANELHVNVFVVFVARFTLP